MIKSALKTALTLLLLVEAAAVEMCWAEQDTRAGQESVPATEADAIKTIGASIEQIVNTAYSAGERPALRDAHAKGHGCVKATFRVRADIPKHLRQGVFEKDRSFPAWIRFSNGNGTPHDDNSGDGRGMAIKLMGVDGPKILEGELQAKTQDFVMINYPAFFIRNAADYVTFSELSKQNKANEFFGMHPHEAEISAAITKQTVANVLEQRYFSMTPYMLGESYIKFSAIPVACDGGARINPSSTQAPAGEPNYLRNAMVDWLKAKEACFHLAVQPQTDAASMPIEDPTIIWDESKAPFINVAQIRISKQAFDAPAQQAFCESLSFTPWHSRAEHRPVGGINRIRKVVYEEISKLRHRLNKAPRVEPTGNERF